MFSGSPLNREAFRYVQASAARFCRVISEMETFGHSE